MLHQGQNIFPPLIACCTTTLNDSPQFLQIISFSHGIVSHGLENQKHYLHTFCYIQYNKIYNYYSFLYITLIFHLLKSPGRTTLITSDDILLPIVIGIKTKTPQADKRPVFQYCGTGFRFSSTPFTFLPGYHQQSPACDRQGP